MEITTAYPCHAKPICWISIGFDRGSFVISPKRDVTASHLDSYTVGAKTQCALGRNRLPPRFIFIHGGRQTKLDSAEIMYANIFNRGRFVTSLRCDTTALPVSPVHTPWAPTMGANHPLLARTRSGQILVRCEITVLSPTDETSKF